MVVLPTVYCNVWQWPFYLNIAAHQSAWTRVLLQLLLECRNVLNFYQAFHPYHVSGFEFFKCRFHVTFFVSGQCNWRLKLTM